MLPTPDTSHLSFSNVYEPSEDSYLVLDALSKTSEISWLHKRFADGSAPLAVEVGTGSGVVLAFVAANAATLIGRDDVLTLGVDISKVACKAASQTIARNAPGALFLGCVEGDLVSSIKNGSVDLLIFNPPYVPSEDVPSMPVDTDELSSSRDSFMHDSNMLELATDGGEDGMEVTNRLLEELPNVLSSRGIAYVLLCAQNKPERVKEGIRQWRTQSVIWEAETVHSSGKQGGWEKLQIVRISRR